MSASETVLQKSERVDRCLARVAEVYQGDVARLRDDFDVQDAVVLNVLRACEQVIDVGQVLLRALSLGRPATNRDIFTALQRAGVIDAEMSRVLSAMVGFRNLAVHQYEDLDVDILASIVERDLLTLRRFVGVALATLDRQ